jgi:hypothetical protein
MPALLTSVGYQLYSVAAGASYATFTALWLASARPRLGLVARTNSLLVLIGHLLLQFFAALLLAVFMYSALHSALVPECASRGTCERTHVVHFGLCQPAKSPPPPLPPPPSPSLHVTRPPPTQPPARAAPKKTAAQKTRSGPSPGGGGGACPVEEPSHPPPAPLRPPPAPPTPPPARMASLLFALDKPSVAAAAAAAARAPAWRSDRVPPLPYGAHTIRLCLTLPESPSNLELGTFMASLRLGARASKAHPSGRTPVPFPEPSLNLP